MKCYASGGRAAETASPEYVVEDDIPPINHAVAEVLAVCTPISGSSPKRPSMVVRSLPSHLVDWHELYKCK